MSCKATIFGAEDADLSGRFAICPEEVRFWMSEMSQMSHLLKISLHQLRPIEPTETAPFTRQRLAQEEAKIAEQREKSKEKKVHQQFLME